MLETRLRRLKHNTIASLVFQVTSVICGFIVPRMIIDAYGSNVNGLVNSISQFLAIISFLELGVGAVVQSSLYKPLSNQDNYSISKIYISGQKFFTKIGVILFIYVIILIAVYPRVVCSSFNNYYTIILIIAMSISLFAQYFFGIVNRLLITADQKGYVSYHVQTVTLVMNTVVTYILIRIGTSIQLVKLISSFVYLLRPIVLEIYVRKNYQLIRRINYSIEPIKQKWNGIAQHICAVVLEGTDPIVLTFFSNIYNVSIYSVYHLIVYGIKQLFLSATNGFQSLIGELWAKHELKELENFFSWVEWIIHTSTVYIFGLTGILIIPFIKVYTYGIKDANYIQPFFAILIVVANACHCLRLPYNILILAGCHYKQTQNSYIIATVLNLTISIFGVKQFGLIGVAFGTLIAMIYQTIWMVVYDSKNFIKWPIKLFIKQIIVDLITVLIMIVATHWIILHKLSYLHWIVMSLYCAFICLLIIVSINYIFFREKTLLTFKAVANYYHLIRDSKINKR